MLRMTRMLWHHPFGLTKSDFDLSIVIIHVVQYPETLSALYCSFHFATKCADSNDDPKMCVCVNYIIVCNIFAYIAFIELILVRVAHTFDEKRTHQLRREKMNQRIKASTIEVQS